jgi:hypothetical protein
MKKKKRVVHCNQNQATPTTLNISTNQSLMHDATWVIQNLHVAQRNNTRQQWCVR